MSGVDAFNDYEYLTPIDPTTVNGLTEPTAFSFTPVPSLGSGTAASGRAIPDLSFDGDPQTGYAVYDPQFKALYGASVVQYGGTSFVAPQLNAVSAVYASALGHRVGFWNPVIYAAAQSASSPFTPIDIDQQFQGSRVPLDDQRQDRRDQSPAGSVLQRQPVLHGDAGDRLQPGQRTRLRQPRRARGRLRLALSRPIDSPASPGRGVDLVRGRPAPPAGAGLPCRTLSR